MNLDLDRFVQTQQKLFIKRMGIQGCVQTIRERQEWPEKRLLAEVRSCRKFVKIAACEVISILEAFGLVTHDKQDQIIKWTGREIQ